MRLLVLCCMAILATTAAATTVSEVPDPRPASGIVDLAGVLDSDSTAAIAASISKAGLSGELMVVVVDSTGGVGARTWTTQLFNRLRIDAKARNRGVLLVAAVKDRKAEIVIGDGFNDDVTQITDRIMAESIVARFKRGDPRAAMVEGAAAIADKVITETAKPGDETVAPISSELASALAAATASPQMKRVVDPRPQRVLLDTAQLLKAKDAKALEAIVAARVATTIDLVVVTIKDIGTHDLEVFAQAVSAKLAVPSPSPSPSPSPPSSSSAEIAANDASDAIGSAPLSKHSVLVLAVAKTKAVIIVPGAGFPEYTTTLLRAAAPALPAQAKKQGVGGATRAAVDVVAEVAELIRTTEVQLAAVAAASAEAQRQRDREAQRERARQAVEEQERQAQYELKLSLEHGLGFYAGGLGLLGVGGLGLREALRRRPRKCRKCKVSMHRLDEETDDKHLNAGELSEERLGSVDYDIWACGACGEVLKTRWGAIFSRYSRCTSCQCRTMSRTTHTLVTATEYSTGLAEITEDCRFCSYHRVSQRTIPRRPKRSSSSSSSSFSSGSSGGGSSSGRGSSGSW